MGQVPRREHLRFNMDQLLDIVGKGVRRASSFMALGIRVSADETVNSIMLDGNFRLQFMPENMSIDQVRHIQRAFRPWIIGNGLRELDQAASIFADRVFEVRTLAGFQEQVLTEQARRQIKIFRKKTNVARKLQSIAEEYGIDSPLRVHMPGLSNARNALTHNMGIVGEQHCTDAGELRLSWIGFELVAGDRIVAGNFEPIQVAACERIEFRTADRVRMIPLHSPIELSPHDLHEICLTHLSQSREMINQLQGQLLGILRRNPAQNDNP